MERFYPIVPETRNPIRKGYGTKEWKYPCHSRYVPRWAMRFGEHRAKGGYGTANQGRLLNLRRHPTVNISDRQPVPELGNALYPAGTLLDHYRYSKQMSTNHIHKTTGWANHLTSSLRQVTRTSLNQRRVLLILFILSKGGFNVFHSVNMFK